MFYFELVFTKNKMLEFGIIVNNIESKTNILFDRKYCISLLLYYRNWEI